MDAVLLNDPALIFWTPYDPLDLASDSQDPLGFARGYLSIADKFLPSFTTVTNVPRYVSMLCAALRAAQEYVPSNPNVAATKIRSDRLQAVKSYERAWAIGCGLASRQPEIGSKAVEGLRGVTYVNRRLQSLAGSKYVQTSSFDLLSDQVRYGGIGVYSSFIEACHLASMQSLSLRPLGEELAAAFPGPGEGLRVYDEDARLFVGALEEWGSQAHQGRFTDPEAKLMRRALSGGEETEQVDQVRNPFRRVGPAQPID